MASILERIANRRGYGLLTRSALYRLSRLGVTIAPYVLYLEKPAPQGTRPCPYSVEKVTQDNLERIISQHPGHAITAATWRRRVAAGNLGLVVKDGAELVGYTWASLGYCRGVAVRPLFELSGEQAYLFDMYVAHAYRGRGVAPSTRELMYAALAPLGRTELYSISEYFNTPARRFKERLSAEPVELRLAVTLFRRWRADVRLRKYRSKLPTRWRAVSTHPSPDTVT